MLRMLFLLLVAVTLAPVADAGNLKANRIVVEKAKRQLTLYVGAKAVKTYRIALGGNPIGHKQQEGDSRTPEGKYTIDAKNPNSSFYKSLHISYPANRDRAQARRRGVSPGGAIMIHGTPDYLAELSKVGIFTDWTAGCIAVTNAEIDEIYAAIRTGTPIEIRP